MAKLVKLMVYVFAFIGVLVTAGGGYTYATNPELVNEFWAVKEDFRAVPAERKKEVIAELPARVKFENAVAAEMNALPEERQKELYEQLAKSRDAVFENFKNTLESLGYKVWVDVIDCAEYGLPQRRNRTVLLASLHGDIKLREPVASEARTVEDVIKEMPVLRHGGTDKSDRLLVASRLSDLNYERIQHSKPGGTWRDWPKRLVAKRGERLFLGDNRKQQRRRARLPRTSTTAGVARPAPELLLGWALPTAHWR